MVKHISGFVIKRKKRKCLTFINDALNTFYLRFIWRRTYGKGGFRLREEGRKEMFYLTTHSTHFYLRLYGVVHMVKDHSDSERKKGRKYFI